MSELRKAAEQALKALDNLYLPGELKRVNEAIAALRASRCSEALNEPHVTAADARLIAAAPELLEALKAMMSIVNDSRGVDGYYLNGNIADWDVFDEVHEARAAIAKAEGRT